MANPEEHRPIYVVSGGDGTSGRLLLNTVLAQFPDHGVEVAACVYVQSLERIDQIMGEVDANDGVVVHTLVDDELRRHLCDLADSRGVLQIDLMGNLVDQLTTVIGRPPLGEPGLFRRLNSDYFSRVDAIEFALAHDDGARPDQLNLADIVLVGVSRVGKTPLSMYLAVSGWKVANVVFVSGLPLPSALGDVDRKRVIGLTLSADTLVVHRRKRHESLGTVSVGYARSSDVAHEVEAANELFRQRRYRMVDVTDKPMESTADEVIRTLTQSFGERARRARAV